MQCPLQSSASWQQRHHNETSFSGYHSKVSPRRNIVGYHLLKTETDPVMTENNTHLVTVSLAAADDFPLRQWHCHRRPWRLFTFRKPRALNTLTSRGMPLLEEVAHRECLVAGLGSHRYCGGRGTSRSWRASTTTLVSLRTVGAGWLRMSAIATFIGPPSLNSVGPG